MHYKRVHITEFFVVEGARHRADHIEPHVFPQPHGAFIGHDDQIELHGTKPAASDFLHGMGA